ncbi:hypothetical protein ES319_A09G112000v1 [Gossypium barbadense]|uniref:Uncharacterized protein n=1 Tax=Gossypium barbadense TaxID=3634 RepID=A0A5J5UDC3_GOSBA|nr:hypothetical protein ES319_A09G112000v1 [Gossypium barbadense]
MVMATINAFYCIPTSLDNNAVGILLQIIFPIYLLTILHRRWSYYLRERFCQLIAKPTRKPTGLRYGGMLTNMALAP